MYPNTNPPVDKVGQVVIHLPDDATFYGERSCLPVSLDLVGGSKTASLLRAGAQGIHYMARYEVFSALCRDGAQRTVDQTPLVGGAPVRPERYLGMWREAIASSISAETAAKEHGIRAVAVLRAPLAAMAGRLGPHSAEGRKSRRRNMTREPGSGEYRVNPHLTTPIQINNLGHVS